MSLTLAQGKANLKSHVKWKTGMLSCVLCIKSKLEMVKHVKIFTKCWEQAAAVTSLLWSASRIPALKYADLYKWKQKLPVRKLRSWEMKKRHQRSPAYVLSQKGNCTELYSYTHRHTVFPTGVQKQKNQYTTTIRHKNEPWQQPLNHQQCQSNASLNVLWMSHTEWFFWLPISIYC